MPRQHGKKYREAASAIEEGKFYPPVRGGDPGPPDRGHGL